MIKKVIVNKFKKFSSHEFELANRIVISGPNNSGKTTLLQAVCTWFELASRWREQPSDLVRDSDENYPAIELYLSDFSSVPLTDFDHLWFQKNTKEPLSVWLRVDSPKSWTIGFEFLYVSRGLAKIRPCKEVKEDALSALQRVTMTPTYIPAASGPNRLEDFFDRKVIPQRLAHSQSGEVLRNMLYWVSLENEKWSLLKQEIKSFFGYEILPLSPGAQVAARYRRYETEEAFDITSASSGFLQVLSVFGALLYQENTIVLVDEPDAHLHTLLQRKMYTSLKRIAQKTQSQLIMSTHSERFINAADSTDLRVLTYDEGLREIPAQQLRGTLKHLENADIIKAETTKRVLYVEGKTDIAILTAWAEVLDHEAYYFLDQGLVLTTAEKRNDVKHRFQSMQALVPAMLGAQLMDLDNEGSLDAPHGMICLKWKRKEIENYLIHPRSIIRYVEALGGKSEATKAEKYLRKNLPPALFDNPFDHSPGIDPDGKTFLTHLVEELDLNAPYSFDELASQMKPHEIHPEVKTMLDQIAKHLNLAEYSVDS